MAEEETLDWSEYLTFPEDQFQAIPSSSSTCRIFGHTHTSCVAHTLTPSDPSVDLQTGMISSLTDCEDSGLSHPAAPTFVLPSFPHHPIPFDRHASTSAAFTFEGNNLLHPAQQALEGALDDGPISSSTVATFPSTQFSSTYIPPKVVSRSSTNSIRPVVIQVPQFIQLPTTASSASVDTLPAHWNASSDVTSWSRIKGPSHLSLDFLPPLQHLDRSSIHHIPPSIDELVAVNRHLDPNYKVQSGAALCSSTLPIPSPSIGPSPGVFESCSHTDSDVIEREYTPWRYPSTPLAPQMMTIDADMEGALVEARVSFATAKGEAKSSPVNVFFPTKASKYSSDTPCKEHDEEDVGSSTKPLSTLHDSTIPRSGKPHLEVSIEEDGQADLLLAVVEPRKFAVEHMWEGTEAWTKYRGDRDRPRVFPKRSPIASSCSTATSPVHVKEQSSQIEGATVIHPARHVTPPITPTKTTRITQTPRSPASQSVAGSAAPAFLPETPKKKRSPSKTKTPRKYIRLVFSAMAGFLENIHPEIDAIFHDDTEDAVSPDKQYAARKMRHDEKIFHMVASGKYAAYLDWNSEGDAIIIPDVSAFETHIMPIYFTSKDFKSFLRQCSNMGISRERHDRGFSLKHEMLLKSNDYLFEYISRLDVDRQWVISGLLPAPRRVRFVQSSPALRPPGITDPKAGPSSADGNDRGDTSPVNKSRTKRKPAGEYLPGATTIKKVRSAPTLRRSKL